MTDVKSDPTPHMHTAAAVQSPPGYATQNMHPLTPMATGGSFATSQQPAYGAPGAQPAAHPQQGGAYPQQGGAYPQQGGAYPQQSLTGHPQQANPQQAYPQQPHPMQGGSPYPQQTYVAGAVPQQQYFQPQPPPQPSLLQQQAAVGQQFQQQLMGQCAMGAHSPRTTYGACGIIAAIVFFPIGLIFLFIDVRTECTRCGMVMR